MYFSHHFCVADGKEAGVPVAPKAENAALRAPAAGDKTTRYCEVSNRMDDSVLTVFSKTIRSKVKGGLKFVVYKCILPLLFRWYARKPIDEKLVLFADHRDRAMPDNFVNLYEMCQANGYHCVVFSGKPFAPSVPKWKRRKEKARFFLAFIRLYAQCGVLFLVDYFPLAYIVKARAETQVVQLWHGCGLLKRVGYAVTSNKWGLSETERRRYPMHTNYTLVPTSSPYLQSGYQEAFRCGADVIQALGVPRTDIYFNRDFVEKAKEKARKLFPGIGNRKIVLYAPTYRGRSIGQSFLQCNFDYRELKRALSDKYVMLTKFHPLMATGGLAESERSGASGFVYDATGKLTPEEALCAADILISDYSSIMFEYLLLERPMISYIYDIDEYVRDRGTFFPYDETLPGPYVFDQKDLIDKLLTAEAWFNAERTREYKNRYMSACDGHSTERIYHRVFKSNTGEGQQQ